MRLLKLSFLSVILLFLLVIKGYSQSSCHISKWINPTPTSNNLKSVFFTDAQTGYVTGVKGTILKTIDGGENWSLINTGTSTYDINSVWFTSPDIGYIGGSVNSSGKISKTTDGGKTWTDLISGLTPGPVSTLYFVSKDTGFAGCSFGKLYRTIDAGKNWSPITVSGASSGAFKDIQFTTDSTVFMVTDSKIFKSVNKGLSWTNTTLPGSSFTISSMHFPAKDTGYVTGGLVASLFKTTDGGTTWTKMVTTGLYGSPSKIYFTSADTGYISTSDNNIFRTVDGGSNWSLTSGNPVGSILSFYFVNKNLGFGVGNYGTVVRISGNEVTKLRKGSSAYFYEIDFTSAQTGYICGSGGTIIKTNDRAKTWNPLTTGTTETLYCINFPDALNGFAAGSNGVVLKTTNGGTSWTKYSGASSGTTFAMSFVDSKIGYRGGTSGFISKTVNGGSTWTYLTTGITSQINDLFFINADTGYAAAGAGIILKTKDQGATWTKLNTGTTYSIGKVIFINPLKGYAFGENGVFLTTTNAGQTWTKSSAGWGDYIRDAAFYDENNAYFVTGDFNGAVYSTSDGTQSWQTDAILNDGYLYNLYILSKDSVLVTGPSGLIVMLTKYSQAKPVITISENTLTASAGADYQWFKDGVLLPAEISKSCKVISAGNYSVRVSDENGCSALSDEIFADVVTDLTVSKNTNVVIFPNPVENFCTVKIKHALNSGSKIEITDITGRLVNLRELDMTLSGDALDINTSQLPEGVYMIRISSEGTEYYGKFLKF